MTRELVKTDAPGFLLDKKTNTILNTNEDDLLRYKREVQAAMEISDLRRQVHELINRVTELERLVAGR